MKRLERSCSEASYSSVRGVRLQVLGLLVSWSTFLMIGATSGLTFNVIGHLKLIIVLAGGVAFFGDQMPPKKLAGVCVALAGIAWYSFQVRCTSQNLVHQASNLSSQQRRLSLIQSRDIAASYWVPSACQCCAIMSYCKLATLWKASCEAIAACPGAVRNFALTGGT